MCGTESYHYLGKLNIVMLHWVWAWRILKLQHTSSSQGYSGSEFNSNVRVSLNLSLWPVVYFSSNVTHGSLSIHRSLLHPLPSHRHLHPLHSLHHHFLPDLIFPITFIIYLDPMNNCYHYHHNNLNPSFFLHQLHHSHPLVNLGVHHSPLYLRVLLFRNIPFLLQRYYHHYLHHFHPSSNLTRSFPKIDCSIFWNFPSANY